MNKKYLLSLLFLLICHHTFSQDTEKQTGLYLFADREYCTSGDTIWFKVFQQGNSNKSNIVHVQLTATDDRVIASVSGKSKGELAEGYIYVPDSLSSGVYYLSAFRKDQVFTAGKQFLARSLVVYNRFSERIVSMNVPLNGLTGGLQQINKRGIIHTDRQVYNARDVVSVMLELSELQEYGMREVVVKAERMDEVASSTGGYFNRLSAASDFLVQDFVENDGILIGGKVTNKETGDEGKNVVVLLSLLNDPQYLDYCITDNDGRFNFFLKEAVGTGELILQTISGDNQEWDVKLNSRSLNLTNPPALEMLNLTAQQSDFIEETVDASYFTRIFSGGYEVHLPEFSMPRKFDFPIYGKPYGKLVLADYYDLPDFQEVSRELLHGVKYRQKGNDITIRLLNLNADEYFKSEPLRLINGIPVFENRMFASMGSEDIDYIDYVLEDRLYGDLRFSGVLAIYLKDNSNGWMSKQPNLFRFTVPLLQPQRSKSYLPETPDSRNLPDFRQVYYWQLHDADDRRIEFILSDLKGKIKITVEGVTAGGAIFNSSEIIEVK